MSLRIKDPTKHRFVWISHLSGDMPVVDITTANADDYEIGLEVNGGDGHGYCVAYDINENNPVLFSSWEEFVEFMGDTSETISINNDAIAIFDEETYIANGGEYYTDPQGNRFPCIDMNKVAPLGAAKVNVYYKKTVNGKNLIIKNIYSENDCIMEKSHSNTGGIHLKNISFLNIYHNYSSNYSYCIKCSSANSSYNRGFSLENVRISYMINNPNDSILISSSSNGSFFGCSFNMRYIYQPTTVAIDNGTFKNCTFNIFCPNVGSQSFFYGCIFKNCKFTGTLKKCATKYYSNATNVYGNVYSLTSNSVFENCLVDLNIINFRNGASITDHHGADGFSLVYEGGGSSSYERINSATIIMTDNITNEIGSTNYEYYHNNPIENFCKKEWYFHSGHREIIFPNRDLSATPPIDESIDKDWLIDHQFPLMWEDP